MSQYDSEKIVKAIRRKIRRKYSAEEKIRIVLKRLSAIQSPGAFQVQLLPVKITGKAVVGDLRLVG